jgi:hypothetical protein
MKEDIFWLAELLPNSICDGYHISLPLPSLFSVTWKRGKSAIFGLWLWLTSNLWLSSSEMLLVVGAGA